MDNKKSPSQNGDSQVNLNKNQQSKKSIRMFFNENIPKILLLLAFEVVVSKMLGKFVYCGIEGTCDAPFGYTYLFLSVWLSFDLFLLIILAFKNHFSLYEKIIILILFLISPLLIYGSNLVIKQDDINLEKQRQEYRKRVTEERIREMKAYQKERPDAIKAAIALYNQKKSSGVDFSSSPCLSNQLIDNWAVDIVHNPRQEVDNLPQSQCITYRDRKVDHIVELDPDGNLIRTN